MNSIDLLRPDGYSTQLPTHPVRALGIGPGTALQPVQHLDAVTDKGILGDNRYFGRLSSETGLPSRRQVSLIEREQIAEHAAALGLPGISPGLVRSNIETTGVNLISLLGNEVEIGEAVLLLHSPRDPCWKMDAICQGLRERMMNRRQGVMAEVVRSGKIKVGDPIRLRIPSPLGSAASPP